MEHGGYITTLKNVRPHDNADRLQLGDCFGNTVCVSLEYTEGMIGVYFPSGIQLSEEFCEVNNLVRKKDENGNPIAGSGYLDPNKRNVTTIRLRECPSDGLYLPLCCLKYCYPDISDEEFDAMFKEGDIITVVNGHPIATKYIPKKTPSTHSTSTSGKKNRKPKKSDAEYAPLFAEHVDTEQLVYNLDRFKPGDQIEITLKIHGTSQRTSHSPVLKRYKRNLCNFIFHGEGKPIYEYDYVTGTRRTILGKVENSFYGNEEFRKSYHDIFKGKLYEGESVYYEVCGFTTSGKPIMADGNNKKLNDKEFIKKYGDTTVFSYGCESPNSDMYVYRMTLTTPEGYTVEYAPDYTRYRCEQMGIKTVPVLWSGFIPSQEELNECGKSAGEWIKDIAEQYYDGPDPIGKSHIREGVVVRIINRPNFVSLKYKNFSFKALTSGAIDNLTTEEINNISDDILSEM